MIYKVGDFLIRSKEIIVINDNEYYKRVTVKMNHNGVVQRDKVLGSEIKTKRQYLVRKGQFIMSRIDARHGAFGIIPDELEGAIITGDFLAFDIDTDKVNLEYFTDLIKSSQFIKFCIDSSTGTTNRKRLKEELFLKFEIEVSNKEKQDKVVEKINNFKDKYLNLKTELKQKAILVERLKESILQKAVQGKLVQQDENDEPASILLRKIREEKDQLNKIEKQLPKITEEEKPFILPNRWEWVRLADIFYFQKGFAFKSKDYKSCGVKIAKVSNLNNPTLNDFVYIDATSKKLYEKYELLVDDIVLTTVGSWPLDSPASAVGNAILIQNDFNGSLLNQNAVRLRTDNLIDSKFLYYILRSRPFKNYIISVAQGTANQASITQDSIKKYLVGIPPFNEQKRIVQKIDQLLTLCDELERNIEHSKEKVERLMKTVLQEAFTINEEKLN